LIEHFNVEGYAVAPSFVAGNHLDRLSELVRGVQVRIQQERRVGGVRHLLAIAPDLSGLVRQIGLDELACEILGGEALVVRSILFDKHPESNWTVPWHQDLTIAVKERINANGFEPWSVKDGVVHVQPPATILERMVTLRISIDECGKDNGPLWVVPRSHTRGIIELSKIPRFVDETQAVPCCTLAGGLVIMRPLILHSSAKAMRPTHRRVLHLEYGLAELPGGLRYAPA